MLGIILTGHGNFATGMASSVQLIAGNMDNLIAVDFEPGHSEVDLKKNLIEALDRLKSCSSVVILTDLMGGTPFKTSVVLSTEYKNCTVIYGSNLPMILEFCMSMETAGDDVNSLVGNAIQIGKEQIDKFVLATGQNDNNEDEEGI